MADRALPRELFSMSGGTGSGKTTMLNCLTRYIEPGERIITCEDACELQLAAAARRAAGNTPGEP
jgi:Flp pilus assembly CpaF family ATPase